MKLQAISILLLAALAGCATSSGQSSRASFAGQQPSPATRPAGQAIVKAMAGGLIGGIGDGLDQSEKMRAVEAEYKALEYGAGGQPVTWGDRASGQYGEVVAAQPYRVGSQDCRQYSHTVHNGAQQKVARGTACRNADGTWSRLT